MAALSLATLAPPASAQDLAQSFEIRPELVELANRSMNIAESTVAKLAVPESAGHPFSMKIPFEGAEVTLRLTPHSARASNYKVYHQIADGSMLEVAPGPMTTFRGTIDELPGAIVAGSIVADGFEGKVFMPNDQPNLVIEPLFLRLDAAGKGDHIIYRSIERDSDIIGGCGTTDQDLNIDAFPAGAARGGISGSGLTVADIACDADFEYFLNFGSNTEARDRKSVV